MALSLHTLHMPNGNVLFGFFFFACGCIDDDWVDLLVFNLGFNVEDDDDDVDDDGSISCSFSFSFDFDDDSKSIATVLKVVSYDIVLQTMCLFALFHLILRITT